MPHSSLFRPLWLLSRLLSDKGRLVQATGSRVSVSDCFWGTYRLLCSSVSVRLIVPWRRIWWLVSLACHTMAGGIARRLAASKPLGLLSRLQGQNVGTAGALIIQLIVSAGHPCAWSCTQSVQGSLEAGKARLWQPLFILGLI